MQINHRNLSPIQQLKRWTETLEKAPIELLANNNTGPIETIGTECLSNGVVLGNKHMLSHILKQKS